MVWPAGAAVSEGFVTGTVNVKSRNPTLVSNELGSTVFPGHALVIDISGQVDINSYDRWEEDCFIGICKRREWVEHNWFTAAQLPVLFRVVDESGVVIVENQYARNGRASINVPQISAQAFNRKLRLEAIIPDGSPPINPARSQGQLSVRIQITTSARAAGLPAFLASSRSTAQDLKRAWTYDPFFVEQNKVFLAKELIAHAKNFFPANSPLSANEHRALLEYAGEVDPASSQVSFSIADMYLAQDNPAGAEKELTTLIRQLRQRPNADTDPNVQFALAEAHIKLASTIERARGYANSKDLANVTANYTVAIDIATRHKAPELRSAALYARALAARSRNTSSAMRAAAEDFRAAADGGAATLSGLPVSVSIGGKEFAIADGASSAAVTWVPLGDAKANAIVVEAGRATLLPLAVSQHGRVLARSREAIGWIDLSEPKPEFKVQASIDQVQIFGAQTNGKSSMVSVVSMAGGLPDAYLYRENFARTPVLIDGVQPLAFELAANAQRYVAIGSKGPVITLDLREIGPTTESSLARKQIQGNVQIARISQDGKMFGGLFNVFSANAPPRRVLTVWTDTGQAVEVLSQVPATQPGAAPAELVETFDFVPGGHTLVVATNYGQIATVPIAVGGQFKTLVAAPLQAESARVPARSFTKFSWAGSSLLFAESIVPTRTFSIEWPGATVLDVKVATQADPIPAVGVWADLKGVIGIVRAKQLPFKVRSVRAADAKVIAEMSFEKGSFGMQLLTGGRYACTQESGVEIIDLTSQSKSTIAVGPSMAGLPRDFPEYPMCVASNVPDRWLLVTHTGGPIKKLTQYDGTSKLTDENLLPAVPDDIVLLEKAAASRLGQPFVPPSFVLPHFRPVPGGQANVGVDGKMFAVAIPDAMWREATNQPATKWIGVPYVMLQVQKIEMKRVRLPAGSFPVKIVEGSLRKVIYLRGNKLLWKDLDSDSEGGQLAELRLPPPPPQFAPGPFPSYELRLSGDGTRMLLAEVFFAFPPARSSDIRIRAFQLSASTVKEMQCSFCARHTVAVDAFSDAIPGFRAMPILGPSDEGMNYVVNYADNRVVSHHVSTSRPVVLLPRRPVFLVSEGSVYYISGENEISFLRF
jgi:hypothetical protein